MSKQENLHKAYRAVVDKVSAIVSGIMDKPVNINKIDYELVAGSINKRVKAINFLIAQRRTGKISKEEYTDAVANHKKIIKQLKVHARKIAASKA